MRTYLFLTIIGLFMFKTRALTQSPCKDCACIFQRLDQAVKNEDYESLLKLYRPVKICAPSKIKEIDQKIEILFIKAQQIHKEAQQNTKLALQQEKVAVLQAQSAKKAELQARSLNERTEMNLKQIQSISNQLLSLFVQEAEQSIRFLEYDKAMELTKAAHKLTQVVVENKFRKLYFELLYFYNELYRRDTIINHIDYLMKSYDRLDWKKDTIEQMKDSLIFRKYLKNILKSLDSTNFQNMENKYYPSMVKVHGGRFLMGKEKDTSSVYVAHYVEVSDFNIATTETTYWQYYLHCKQIKKAMESPGWRMEGNHPAVNVTFYDAVEYCNWISKQLNIATSYDVNKLQRDTVYNKDKEDMVGWTVKLSEYDKGFRLPFEAEWEYAAKGGQKSANFIYSGGNIATEVAWIGNNNGTRTQPVATKKPNDLGLFDMSGNVWEWCWDWLDKNYYRKSAYTDPHGPENGITRVIRGGSWGYEDKLSEVTYRATQYSDHRDFYKGFRVVRASRITKK